jgi:hypothetical protein
MFDKSDLSPRNRAERFARSLGIRLPILLAPTAGASPPSLSIAVANAGGLGACGALLMTPEEIQAWGSAFREGSAGGQGRQPSWRGINPQATSRKSCGNRPLGCCCDLHCPSADASEWAKRKCRWMFSPRGGPGQRFVSALILSETERRRSRPSSGRSSEPVGSIPPRMLWPRTMGTPSRRSQCKVFGRLFASPRTLLLLGAESAIT